MLNNVPLIRPFGSTSPTWGEAKILLGFQGVGHDKKGGDDKGMAKETGTTKVQKMVGLTHA